MVITMILKVKEMGRHIVGIRKLLPIVVNNDRGNVLLLSNDGR